MMETFKRFLLLLAATVLTTAVQAQVINGDLNHNGELDVDDVTLLIDGYLTGETEAVKPTVNPYMVDNSLVAGTWYYSKMNSTTLNADGTMGGSLEGTGYTYKYMPFQKHILLYNPDGSFALEDVVLKLTADTLVLKLPDGTCDVLTRTQPKEYVSSIELSQTSVEMDLNTSVQLRVAVYPTYADDPRVSWSSSNDEVAEVDDNGMVYARSNGTATITCEALDGSGAKATCEVDVSHARVDLGLSVKWATMNIGAKSPKKYGSKYAWGETQPKNYYNWSTYDWGNPKEGGLTKYNTSSDYGIVDNKTALDPADDIAHVNWGEPWRMPTVEEWQELMDQCTWTLEMIDEDEEAYGYRVTSKVNGNSILLPCGGCSFDNYLSWYKGDMGYYWSKSLDITDSQWAYCLIFSGSSNPRLKCDKTLRYCGLSVRAVCP